MTEEYFKSGFYIKGLFISEETRVYNGSPRHYALFAVGARAVRVKIPEESDWVGGSLGEAYELEVGIMANDSNLFYSLRSWRHVGVLQ